MITTIAIIDAAMKDHPRACLAFSGGADSLALLDIVYRRTPHRPLVVFADSGMEYPETRPFVEAVCRDYGAALRIASPGRTPEEQWRRQGWPMLGKLAARTWMQKHRGRGFGFRLDVSSCCRNMKIAPARRLARKLGCTLQLTGQRGNQDDSLRGLRAIKDGAFHRVEADRLTICNPLLGWTDMMIRRYSRQNALPTHPARALRAGFDIIPPGGINHGDMPGGVDLIIAAHSHDFIGADARRAARLGAIGYHPSLLPLHRGRDAVRWAVKMGDRVTGGSVYWLNKTVDGGPIAAQAWCFIRPDDTAQELWRRDLFPMGVTLIDRVLQDIDSGRVVMEPQDETLATWEPSWDRPPLYRPDLLKIGAIPGYEVAPRVWRGI